MARTQKKQAPPEARCKATHAIELMLAAQELSTMAASEDQRRVLTRYVFLYGEPAARWIDRWRQELSDNTETAARAAAGEPAARRLRQAWAKHKAVRDKLAAKRQLSATGPAEDLRATVELWRRVSTSDALELCERASAAWEALGGEAVPQGLIDAPTVAKVERALRVARRDSAVLHTGAGTAALELAGSLPIVSGGEVGRRIMQINDLSDHLELIVTLREFAQAPDVLGRVLRSALIVDGCALVELSVGMRGAATPERGEESLITLVDRQRGEEGWDLLRQLAETIPDDTRTDLRWLRDKLGAHIDAHVSLSTLEQALDGLDVNGLIALLDHVLDWLDAAACSHVDLGTLLLGGRAMRSLEASEAPSVVPDDALAELARHADSPYVVMVGGRHGASRTGAVAGAIAGRVTNRRQKWSARVKRGSAA